MKCSESSVGSLGVIELYLKEIIEDKTTATMAVCLDTIASQLEMIKQGEEIV